MANSDYDHDYTGLGGALHGLAVPKSKVRKRDGSDKIKADTLKYGDKLGVDEYIYDDPAHLQILYALIVHYKMAS